MPQRHGNRSAGTAARGAAARLPEGSLLPLWHRIHQEFIAHSQRWGLPPNVWMTALHVFVHPDETEPSTLAAAGGFPRQTITFILDGMERRGLAVRGPHPKDRRRKVVRLTRAGRALARAMFQELMRFEAAALHAVRGPETEALMTFLTRYADALAAYNARGGRP